MVHVVYLLQHACNALLVFFSLEDETDVKMGGSATEHRLKKIQHFAASFCS